MTFITEKHFDYLARDSKACRHVVGRVCMMVNPVDVCGKQVCVMTISHSQTQRLNSVACLEDQFITIR